jgi:hypothetical protein
VSTLPNPAQIGPSSGVCWKHCARCDALFPPYPGQVNCPQCPGRPPGRLVSHPEHVNGGGER